VKNTRRIGKQDMVHNAYLPAPLVDPETYEVRADGELLTLRACGVLPLAHATSSSDARNPLQGEAERAVPGGELELRSSSARKPAFAPGWRRARR